jgi:hypothetical protein
MNEKQLALIEEVGTICDALAIPYWLRGGWAMDFFLGRVTREHDDIDMFVWAVDAPALARELDRAGFVAQVGPPPEAQRNFTKIGEELQVALLGESQNGDVVVAGGPAAGAPWPNGMLGTTVGHLGHLTCPIIEPQVQVEIKRRFPEWRPDLPIYPKHETDIALLREALGRARG